MQCLLTRSPTRTFHPIKCTRHLSPLGVSHPHWGPCLVLPSQWGGSIPGPKECLRLSVCSGSELQLDMSCFRIFWGFRGNKSNSENLVAAALLPSLGRLGFHSTHWALEEESVVFHATAWELLGIMESVWVPSRSMGFWKTCVPASMTSKYLCVI